MTNDQKVKIHSIIDELDRQPGINYFVYVIGSDDEEIFLGIPLSTTIARRFLDKAINNLIDKASRVKNECDKLWHQANPERMGR